MPLDLDCEVLEVENLENILTEQQRPQKLVSEETRVLDCLIPSALSMPHQAFLDVEDLDDHHEFLV